MTGSIESKQDLIELLPWDTSFFGFSVARVLNEAQTDTGRDKVSAALAASGVKLAYYTSIQALDESKVIWTGYRMHHADIKRTYLKKLEACPVAPDPNVRAYPFEEPDEQLVKLAIESGVYSRFNLDPGFESGTFERLYERWIRNSTNKSIAEEVLVFMDGSQIAGFVTLGIKKGRGDIGIIAVDAAYRGQRIGSRLMAAAEYWFYTHGYNQVQVVTQGVNLPACRLYEAGGFHIESDIQFYHLWQNPEGGLC